MAKLTIRCLIGVVEMRRRMTSCLYFRGQADKMSGTVWRLVSLYWPVMPYRTSLLISEPLRLSELPP